MQPPFCLARRMSEHLRRRLPPAGNRRHPVCSGFLAAAKSGQLLRQLWVITVITHDNYSGARGEVFPESLKASVLAKYWPRAKRTSTPIAAASGTAIRRPTKPNK